MTQTIGEASAGEIDSDGADGAGAEGTNDVAEGEGAGRETMEKKHSFRVSRAIIGGEYVDRRQMGSEVGLYRLGDGVMGAEIVGEGEEPGVGGGR